MDQDESLFAPTYIRNDTEEQLHELWATPVIIAKPFGDNFLKQLKEDVKPLIAPGAAGTFNHTDLWQLPDLPDTMLAVKDKMVELTTKYFSKYAEMPLAPFRASKGYFRESKEDFPYRITPHRHSTTFGVGVYYVNADEKNPGNLMLMDPRGGINWLNQFTAFKKIRVEEGSMVIHPGFLVHFVEPSNPEMGMYYGNRLAIVTNIHRTYEEFLNSLKENDADVQKLAMSGYYMKNKND
jgi:hypothetical protein